MIQPVEQGVQNWLQSCPILKNACAEVVYLCYIESSWLTSLGQAKGPFIRATGQHNGFEELCKGCHPIISACRCKSNSAEGVSCSLMAPPSSEAACAYWPRLRRRDLSPCLHGLTCSLSAPIVFPGQILAESHEGQLVIAEVSHQMEINVPRKKVFMPPQIPVVV